MIEVKNLSAAYDGIPVFQNISFTLADESFTALCGKNGSGKSTLLLLMTGIVPAGLKYSGNILIDGNSVFKLKRDQVAQKLSLLLQSEVPVWNLTVRQFVETGLYSYGRMPQAKCNLLVNEALEKIGILDFADKQIFNISGGEFQKCRLARCLVQETPAMLFDEPAEKLDMPFQIQFLQQIKSLKKTMLFSIHDINLAAMFTTDFLLLSNGTVIHAPQDQIFTTPILETVYGSHAQIFTHPVKDVKQVLFN